MLHSVDTFSWTHISCTAMNREVAASLIAPSREEWCSNVNTSSLNGRKEHWNQWMMFSSNTASRSSRKGQMSWLLHDNCNQYRCISMSDEIAPFSLFWLLDFTTWCDSVGYKSFKNRYDVLYVFQVALTYGRKTCDIHRKDMNTNW